MQTDPCCRTDEAAEQKRPGLDRVKKSSHQLHGPREQLLKQKPWHLAHGPERSKALRDLLLWQVTGSHQQPHWLKHFKRVGRFTRSLELFLAKQISVCYLLWPKELFK